MTPTVISPRASRDLDQITDYYLSEAGLEVATSFLTAWDGAVAHISYHPDSGSLRYADAMKIKGLRVWPIRGFPHLALYVTQQGRNLVIRVLHAARDIPVTLRD